ncbi:F510_1955 family glycosylhydrolase [Bacillus sp. PS06]|uniref:F510_1955 family glycosylhydrolase n=1 Tax=Bacillus sp. PS06 TaxID=2764176 RepID=UPI0017841C44|nr:hypothetical protein [Bacillus sp. PS06]MBD8069278.1 hypothetical protein [Bacillus sp. PS06]
MKKILVLISTLILAVFVSACGDKNSMDNTDGRTGEETNQTNQNSPKSSEVGNFGDQPNFKPFDGSIDHIHGLGYAGNQNAIFFAAHDGIKVFDNGSWYKTKTENNDYMGFNVIKDGFISSGHPGTDSKLPNPVGIIRSTDNGQSLEKLGLLGETDFHLMGVGFETNTIYALPPNNNSEMKAGELYVSEDLAKTWENVSAKNLGETLIGLAVHPTNPQIVAAAGEKGIYYSEDKGNTFELLTENKQGTSVYFSNDALWFGGYDGNAVLIKKSLTDGKVEEINLPKMEQDAVAYLAQNSKNPDELVFASFKGNVYRSVDGAKTWTTLVENGEPQ